MGDPGGWLLQYALVTISLAAFLPSLLLVCGKKKDVTKNVVAATPKKKRKMKLKATMEGVDDYPMDDEEFKRKKKPKGKLTKLLRGDEADAENTLVIVADNLGNTVGQDMPVQEGTGKEPSIAIPDAVAAIPEKVEKIKEPIKEYEKERERDRYEDRDRERDHRRDRERDRNYRRDERNGKGGRKSRNGKDRKKRSKKSRYSDEDSDEYEERRDRDERDDRRGKRDGSDYDDRRGDRDGKSDPRSDFEKEEKTKKEEKKDVKKEEKKEEKKGEEKNEKVEVKEGRSAENVGKTQESIEESAKSV